MRKASAAAAPGQRRAGGEPARADQQLAPGAPAGVARGSEYLVGRHSGALGLRVRGEQTTRADHPRRTRGPGATDTLPGHCGIG